MSQFILSGSSSYDNDDVAHLEASGLLDGVKYTITSEEQEAEATTITLEVERDSLGIFADHFVHYGRSGNDHTVYYWDRDGNTTTTADQYVVEKTTFDKYNKEILAPHAKRFAAEHPKLATDFVNNVVFAILIGKEDGQPYLVQISSLNGKEASSLKVQVGKDSPYRKVETDEDSTKVREFITAKIRDSFSSYSSDNFQTRTVQLPGDNGNNNGKDKKKDTSALVEDVVVDLLVAPRIGLAHCNTNSTEVGLKEWTGFWPFEDSTLPSWFITRFLPTDELALNPQQTSILNDFFSAHHLPFSATDPLSYSGCIATTSDDGKTERTFKLRLNPDVIPAMLSDLLEVSTDAANSGASTDPKKRAVIRLKEALTPEQFQTLLAALEDYKIKKEDYDRSDPTELSMVGLALMLGAGGWFTHRLVDWEASIGEKMSVLFRGFLATYGENMNEVYGEQLQDGTKEPFFGRDAIIDEVVERITSKKGTRSFLLLGHKGSGKTAIVEHLAALIHVRQLNDPRLKDVVFFKLKPDHLSGGGKLSGGPRKVAALQRDIQHYWSQGKTIVVFIDEAHGIPKIDRHSESGGYSDVANALKPPLQRGKTESEGTNFFRKKVERIPVVGRRLANRFFGKADAPFIMGAASTIEEWDAHVLGKGPMAKDAGDKPLADRFGTPIVIPDPEGDFLARIVDGHAELEERLYDIEFERDSSGSRNTIIRKIIAITSDTNSDMFETRRSIEFMSDLRKFVMARSRRAARNATTGGTSATPALAVLTKLVITQNDVWEFLMQDTKLPKTIVDARETIRTSALGHLGKIAIDDAVWGQLPGESLEDSIIRRYRLTRAVGEYMTAHGTTGMPVMVPEFDASPFYPRPKPVAPPAAATAAPAPAASAKKPRMSRSAASSARATTLPGHSSPAPTPAVPSGGNSPANSGPPRNGGSGGGGTPPTTALHVEYPMSGSEALAPVEIDRPIVARDLVPTNDPYFGEAPEILRDNVVELFPGEGEKPPPISAANDATYEPANKQEPEVTSRAPRSTTPFWRELKAETAGGAVTMGLMEGAWMGVEHFTGYHPSHSVRTAVDMPALYAGTKLIAGGATLGGFAEGLLPAMVWMMPGMMAGWSGASSVSNFSGEQLGIETLQSGGAANRIVSAVSGGAGGAVSYKMATRFLPKAVLGRAGPLGGAIMAYPLVGEAMDFVADQAGVDGNYSGRTAIQVTTSGALGYLAHAGIQAALSGAAGTTATAGTAGAATAVTTTVAATATTGAVAAGAAATAGTAGAATAVTTTVAATATTGTVAAGAAAGGGGTTATAGGVAAGVSGAAVVAGVAVVTAAAITSFAVYKNATTTDEELGQERIKDNAWGRFLNGDGFLDGIGDALLGAD